MMASVRKRRCHCQQSSTALTAGAQLSSIERWTLSWRLVSSLHALAVRAPAACLTRPGGAAKAAMGMSAKAMVENAGSQVKSWNPDAGRAHRFAVIVDDGERDAFGRLMEQAAIGVGIFSAQELLEGYGLQPLPNGSVTSVHVPAMLLGSAALDLEAEKRLQAADEELAKFFLPGTRSHFTGRDGDSGKFALWLLQRMSQTASVFLDDLRQVRRSLSVLRREHEEALERFSVLERRSGYYEAPTKVRKLFYPPSGNIMSLSGGAEASGSSSSVRQKLSMSANGLASLELHVARAPKGHGKLEVRALIEGDEAPAGAWSEAFTALKPGWNAFQLERALDQSGRDVELEVAIVGEATDRIDLTLSHPTPMDIFSAAANDGSSVNAPLAIRAWGATPGTLVAESLRSGGEARRGTRRTSGAGPRSRIPLGTSDLASATLLYPSGVEMGFNVVDFRSETGDLLVHPTNNGLTIAVIRDVTIRGIKDISALVLLDNAESAPVEFAVAAVGHSQVHRNPTDLLKTWSRVDADAFAEITGTVENVDGRSVDIILGTRMFDQADSHCAWACFKRIDLFS